MSTVSSRKRLRSTECSFMPQSKYFINNNLIEQRDPNRMKLIYDKTLGLLFKGVKTSLNAAPDASDKKKMYQIVKLHGNGLYTFKGEKPNWIHDNTDRKCKSCVKESVLHADCANCNLELCEFCGFSCSHCDEPLCSNCVCLFDCGTIDKPCCSHCKTYIE